MLKKSKRFCHAAGAILALTLAVLAVSGGHAGVVNSPHDFSLPTGLSTKSSAVAPGGVCSACHIPHNALDNVLWARTLSGTNNYSTLLTLDGNPTGELNYRPGYTLQCYDCHDYHFSGGIDDLPAFNNFQSNHKPQNVAFGFQTKKRDASITTDGSSTMQEDPPVGSYSGYYENAPPYTGSYGANPSLASRTDNVALAKTGGHYFRSGDPNASRGIYKGDKLPCSDCHDPHKWAPGWQAFFSPRIQTTNPTQWSTVFNNPALGSSTTPVGSEFMANPLQAGTRTGNDQSSRKLCIVCHGTSSDSTTPGPVPSVTFTQVNPAYNNPVPTLVRPPVGISEHQSASTVACVSCHQHNMIDASCSMCHGFPPSDTATIRFPSTFTPAPDASAVNDSHPRHVGNKQGATKFSSGPYAFPCGTCHYGSAMGFDSALGQHQNNRVSVVIQGVYAKDPNGPGALYDNTNYFNWTYPAGPSGQLDNTNISGGWGAGTRYGGNSCRNVYCHSAGRVQTSMTHDNTTDYPVPRWSTGPIQCNGCHGLGTTTAADNVYGTFAYGMPSYPNAGPGPRANSHFAHVVKTGIECSACHFDTVSGIQGVGLGRIIKGTTSTPHVNLLRDVRFDTSVAGVAASYDNGAKSCNVSCHGAGTPPVWGQQTGLTCFSCHAGAEAASKPQPNQGIPSPVDNVQYASSGHGRTATAYPGDTNPPAGFDNVISTPAECFVCHSLLSKHIGRTAAELTNDPYRLGSSAIAGKPGGLGTFTGNFADNVDLLCLGCHGNAAQRAGHDNAAKGTRTIDAQTHARGITGTEYATWPVTPWKCVDCHDPHGDANLKMVRSGINAPTNTGDTALSGSDVKGTPKRTTVTPVVFTSLAGQAAGSYGSLPTRGQGVCEICHNQTPLFNRSGAGNVGSHVTRTGRCTTCHVHTAGFKGLGGPDLGQYFDRLSGLVNYADNSSHPLRGLTTADNTLRFPGSTENCLACHYSSGTGRVSDECVMCHFEDTSNAPPGNHMDGILQMAAVTSNGLPTSAYSIATLANYDAWCLQCHAVTTVSLGNSFPSAAHRTLIDPAQFAGGRHRANLVGCIYCHQPHGSGNAQIVRNNPVNRMAAGGTIQRFGVFPADNTGAYGTPLNQDLWYRARIDNNYATGNVFADAADENNFCNRACHAAAFVPSWSKERIIKRDGTTGLYQYTGSNQKIYVSNNGALWASVEYTRDNTTSRMHGHVNNEIISTDDMVSDYAARIGLSGPSRFHYPGSGNANPATFNNLTSPLPFFPDYADGSRDFTNGYNGLGLIRYRFTCSTCHNPHGASEPLTNAIGGESYPDLRLRRMNPGDLCNACHK